VGPEAVTPGPRPAFYALRAGGWRDYVTLLHGPYTLWHLSYVALGAALAPEVHVARLLWALAAFALALGVGAHALDELNGRPLRTRIPARVLWALALVSVAAAAAMGVGAAAAWGWWLLAFVGAGGFLVFAYNLELLGGRFHSDLWFGLAWGGFPLLTGYFVEAQRLRPEAVLAAGFAVLLSLAQRALSTQVRTVRRRVSRVSGEVELDGTREPLTTAWLMSACESALRLLTGAVLLLAAALLTWRLR
jgi:hypothetical protein